MARTKIFISYSHKDDRWLELVKEQLAVLEIAGLIEIFEDKRIGAGEVWKDRLDSEMLSAKLAVLLVSAPFLTSGFIRESEVPVLFRNHEQDGMTLYPLLVRACAWQEIPWLARLQMRPAESIPVSSLSGAKREQCLADVAREIADIVKPASTA